MRKLLLDTSSDSTYWNEHWQKENLEKVLNYFHLAKQYKTTIKYLEKEMKILEGGCGLSQWVVHLDSLGFDIYGIDNAKDTVAFVNDKYPQLKISYGDILKIDFEDNYFDCYLSWGVMEHFEDGLDMPLKEANRVIRNGGKLIITVPYQNPFFGFITRRDSTIGKGRFFQYFYNKKELKEALENNGFKVIETVKLNWILGLFELNYFWKNRSIPAGIYAPNQQHKKSGIIKEFIKRLIIKNSDNSLLSSLFGHMIMMVAVKTTDAK